MIDWRSCSSKWTHISIFLRNAAWTCCLSICMTNRPHWRKIPLLLGGCVPTSIAGIRSWPWKRDVAQKSQHQAKHMWGYFLLSSSTNARLTVLCSHGKLSQKCKSSQNNWLRWSHTRSSIIWTCITLQHLCPHLAGQRRTRSAGQFLYSHQSLMEDVESSIFLQ